jgi:hypothetical protein
MYVGLMMLGRLKYTCIAPTGEAIVSEFDSIDFEVAIGKLKKYKLPGIN